MESYGDIHSDIIHHKILDISTTQSELQNLQHRLQRQPESQSNLIEETAVLQCRITWLHLYARRYEEATKSLLGMLREPLVDAHVITGCYDILYDIAVAENKHDLALDMIRKAVETSVEAYGYAHCATARKMARLESYLRSKGRLQEADKVHTD